MKDVVRQLLQRELVRYVIAGTLAFAGDFAVLLLCTEYLGLHYLLSNALGYAAGMGIAYVTNVRWVFAHRRYAHVGLEFSLFNLIVVAGLFVSEGFMFVFVDLAGLHYLLAKVAASVLVFAFNYVARKYLLFSPRTAERDQGRGATA